MAKTVLSETILDPGDRAILDRDKIEAAPDGAGMIARIGHQELSGDEPHRAHLSLRDRPKRPPVSIAPPRLHLDEHEQIVLARNKVDLAIATIPVIPRDDREAALFEMSRRRVLAGAPDNRSIHDRGPSCHAALRGAHPPLVDQCERSVNAHEPSYTNTNAAYASLNGKCGES